MKRPASQWYWADWLRDPAIRASTLEARGLWMDMLALMHEGTPYGHLTVGGEAVSDLQLARMVGETPSRVRKLLKELEAHGVFSRTDEGVMFSRRMVRDEHIRNVRADAGKLGGNPNLTDKGKVNALVNQTVKQKPTPSSSASSSPAVASPSAISKPRFLEPLVEAMNDELSRRFTDYRPVKVDQFASSEYAEKIEQSGVPLEAAERLLRKACRFFNPSKHGRGEYPGSLKYFAQSIIDDWKRDPKPMLEIIPSVVKGASA